MSTSGIPVRARPAGLRTTPAIVSSLALTIALSLTLAAALLSAGVCRADWPSDPNENLAVADGAGEQVLPKIAVTPDGGFYIGWFDTRTGAYQVRLQRLTAAGAEAWPHNGILVSDHPQSSSLVEWDLIADSQGNCAMVFTDTRGGDDLDVHAYKISPEGALLWGEDGVTLSANNDYEPGPQLTEAGDGDFVFVWPQMPDAGNGSIRMQRLSPAGEARFAFGGIPIASESGRLPAFADVAPSLAGDVIVSWVRDISSFNSPRHIRTQRFDSAGAAVWPAFVSVLDEAPVPLGYFPRVRSDQAGGALFVWHRSLGNMYNAAVQRLTPAGTEMFPHNGAFVSTNTTRHHLDPTMAYLPSTGEIFVFWNERNQNQSQWGIYGQKFSGGIRQWTDTGIAYLPVDDTYEFLPQAVAWDTGAIVIWGDEPTGQSMRDRLVGMRVDGSGTSLWPSMPLEVSSVLSSKSRLPLVISPAGTAVIVWEDDRNDTQDVYAQNVNADGTLGSSPTGMESAPATPPGAGLALTCRPSLFSDQTEIAVIHASGDARLRTTHGLESGNAAEGSLSIGIYDLAGSRVRSLALDHAGTTVIWDGRDERGGLLPSGVYLCRSEGSRAALARVVLIR